MSADAHHTKWETAEDFLREIYEHPEDDDLRLVFGDWLQERGDPRGEFIILQYAKRSRELTAAEARRESALLRKHARTWLGPLARFTLRDSVDFERGFLARCEVSFRSGMDAQHAPGAPEWATVEMISGGYAKLLIHPVMRSLRDVRDVSADAAIALAAEVNLVEIEADPWKKPKSTTCVTRPLLTTLTVNVDRRDGSSGLARALATTDALPNLRHLGLTLTRDDETRASLADIWASPLATQLESFFLTLDDNRRGAAAYDAAIIAELARREAKEEEENQNRQLDVTELKVRLMGKDIWQLDFRRGKGGRYSILDIWSHWGKGESIDGIVAVLARLPNDLLTELTVTYAKESEALTAQAKRQTRLKELRLQKAPP